MGEPAGDLDPAPSAFAKALGVEVTAWEAGFVRLEAPIADWHLNRTAIVHGGVAAAMLDMACGFAGLYVAPDRPLRQGLTLSLSLNFTGQASRGRMIAEGRVKRAGRRIYFAEATLVEDTGQLLAFATGVFRYRSGS